MNFVLPIFRSNASSRLVADVVSHNSLGRHVPPALARHQKISDFFDKLEKADARRTDEKISLSCYHLIQELQKNERQLRDVSRAGDGPRKKELKHKQKILAKQLAELTPQGLHGLSNDSNDRLWRRRQQWKAAAIEGLHTWSARVCASASGVVGAEVSGAGSKAAVHQSLGYLPQAILSGLLRIVTETLQVRVNEAGKPKMAPNLAITSDFKTNNPQLQQARQRLLEAARILEQAIGSTPGDAPVTDQQRQEVAQKLEKMMQVVDCGSSHADMDENLWVRLKQDFKSKEFSAIVSVIAGAASFAALGIDQSGAATIAAHKLLCLLGTLLQMPASFFDYMQGSVDFPEEKSAQKLDPRLLLKPESRNKKPDEVTDADIDTAIALKLYDEQPQLVRQVVRAISLHGIGKLNARKLALQDEIENRQMRDRLLAGDPLRRGNNAAVIFRRDKARELQRVESELNELLTQHTLFEQHQRYQLDPNGLIGRALIEPLFFWRKGASEGIFNQMGAAMSQINQRLNTNWNPLGIGLASLGVDIANAQVGDHFVQDAQHSLSGEGLKNAAAEQALAGTATATAIGALDNGLMNGPARFGKGVFDRKELGMPPQIGEGVNIAADNRRQKIEQAADKGLLSKSQRKLLSRAATMLDAIEAPASSLLTLSPKEITRMQEHWKRFEELCNIQTKWCFPQVDNDSQPVLGYDGTQVVIDARSTSAAYFRYIPVRRRARLLAEDVPKSMWNSMRFWKDIASSRLAAHQWRQLVNGTTLVDDGLRALEDRAKRLLELPPQVQLPELKDEHVAGKGSLATFMEFERELNVLARMPIWDAALEHAATPLDSHPRFLDQDAKEKLARLRACLHFLQAEDFAGMSPERRDALRNNLQFLATGLLALRKSFSKPEPESARSAILPAEIRQAFYREESVHELDESIVRIKELQRDMDRAPKKH